MTKFLIIRFSSIGDIVLTTPVVRCLKEQFKGETEIHFLTKKNFEALIVHNPYIDQCHFLEDSTSEMIKKLKLENFDYIIDLHHNIRTLRVKKALGVKSFSFNKVNIEKWLMVNFKKNRLPRIHIVDRYLETLKEFGIRNDYQGLDFFYPKEFQFNSQEYQIPEKYIALVIGAKFNTKRFPEEKISELCRLIKAPIVLLGGPEEEDEGKRLASSFEHVLNLCGMTSLMESAKVVEQAEVVVCNDTGLMHIASAFTKNIVSIWGNTIPEFGMYPYLEESKYSIHQVDELNCRPCSKIGYKSCPKKHFNCMEQQNVQEISEKILEFTSFRS